MAFQFRDLMMNVVPGETFEWKLTCGPISADQGIRREDPDSPDTTKIKPPKEKDKDKDKDDKEKKHLSELASLQEQLRQALRGDR